MRKLIIIFLILSPTIGRTTVMNSYRLVWDTSKIASLGMGLGYNIFKTNQYG